jgi:dipeptidyl aminopeptidase/acylaminoacyl peptidase
MTEPSAEPTVAPYGSWRSPIRIDDVVGDTITLAEPWVDGDEVFWLEGRPAEGGRRVLVRAAADGSTADLTPAPFNVRTRVHEYGGGSYVVTGGVVVFSDFGDGRLYRLDPGADAAVPITPAGPWRYADLRPDRARRRFYAVREDHGGGGEAVNSIVAIPLDGGEPTVLVTRQDFVGSPRLSPDGGRLAWLEWDHPDMPWDNSRLRVAPIAPDGTLGEPTLAAGGPDESIVQPEWSPDGTLYLISDRTGWWNLYRLVDGPRLEPLGPLEAEFADPSWILDRSSYGFLPDGAIVAVARADGRDHLFRLEPGNLIGEVDTPFTELDAVRVGPATVVALAGAPGDPAIVARFDPATLAPAGVLRRASTVAIDPTTISRPEAIEFPTTAGRTAHALYYPPTNPDFVAPDGERPPLLVLSHGGPTSNASTALDPTKQLLTSRGIAVVDVDYGGSTGYGRAYRQQLEGMWGVVDVDDCVAAARFLVERGDADPNRLAIEGGSAGGYTTLAALAFRDVFAAGISLFGIGDLEGFEATTHKFESHYATRLLGSDGDIEARYRERSPGRYPEAFKSPVLILQGLDDRIVPPSQAEGIAAALATKGIPHAYLAFEGEGHGFRGAYAIRRTLEARLSFLGQIFGFTLADAVEPVELPGLDAWRAAHPRAVAARRAPGPPATDPSDAAATAVAARADDDEASGAA